MNNQEKTFYLGFHKTGTTSFGTLMKTLGFKSQTYYKPYSPRFVDKLTNNDLEELFEIADEFDTFEDDPWYLFYKEFEQRYPKAKFILYERNPEKWYESCLFFFGRASSPMNELIFGKGTGSPLYNKEHHISVYKQHSAEVRDYFKDKPEKFLEIPDLSDKSAQSIARFIGHDAIGIKFPYMNYNRLNKMEKIVRQSKLKLAKLLRLSETYISRDD